MRNRAFISLHVLALVLILSIACLTLISCDSNAKINIENTGTLRIVFPDNSRSLLNSEAASIANNYSVAIWNSDGNVITVNSDLHNDEIPLISLAAGTYKVIGFASCLGNDFATIVGTGYEPNVLVEANQTTNVVITLSAPTVVLDVPETAYVSETITIPTYVSFGDTPLTVTTGYYYLRNADGSINKSNISNGNTKKKTTELLLPLTEGEYYFEGYFGSLLIVDECFSSSFGTYLLSFEGYSWSVGKLSEDFVEYNGLFHQKITVITRPTSLAMSFVWAED